MSYKKFARKYERMRYRTALGAAPAMALFLLHLLTPLDEFVPEIIFVPLLVILFLVGTGWAVVSLCREDLERNMVENQEEAPKKSDAHDQT